MWLFLQIPFCLQAQEPQRFFERHYIDDLIFMNENDLLVLGADEAADVALYKVDENGELYGCSSEHPGQQQFEAFGTFP